MRNYSNVESSPSNTPKLLTAWQLSTTLDDMEKNLIYLQKNQLNINILKQTLPNVQKLKKYEDDGRLLLTNEIRKLYDMINQKHQSLGKDNKSLKSSNKSDNQTNKLLGQSNQFININKQNMKLLQGIKSLEKTLKREEQSYYQTADSNLLNQVRETVLKAQIQMQQALQKERSQYMNIKNQQKNSIFIFHFQNFMKENNSFNTNSNLYKGQIQDLSKQFGQSKCKLFSLKDKHKKLKIREKINSEQVKKKVISKSSRQDIQLSKAELQQEINEIKQEMINSKRKLKKKIVYCVQRLKMVIFQQRKLQFQKNNYEKSDYIRRKQYFSLLFSQYKSEHKDLSTGLVSLPKYLQARLDKQQIRFNQIIVSLDDITPTMAVQQSKANLHNLFQNFKEFVLQSIQRIQKVYNSISKIDNIEFINSSECLADIL